MTTPTKAATAAVLTLICCLSALLLPAASASANDEAVAGGGSWHQVHWHINAYRQTAGGQEISGVSGRCYGSWRDPSGQCFGYGERKTWHDSFPFRGYTHIEWSSHPAGCPDVPGGRDPAVWVHQVKIKTGYQGTGEDSFLCGWVDRGWNTMVVTGGKIRGYDGYLHDVQPSNGRLAEREHVQGGPLYVFLDASRDQGAVIGLRGWIRY
ncbi:hypothetical protein ACFP8W_10210 [Nocardioides hankookensis]|uniref:Secreted protein n=1 Tax=Nocardioides hankookensis TaxID=443157 RepID=A0ABW1LH43_9ACTN